MYARYDIATRRLKHWSTVPYTTPPGSGEADVEVAGTLPGPRNRCRLTTNLAGVELDPALAPDPIAVSDARVDREDGAWLEALLTHLPTVLAEHAATGDIDSRKWLGRLRATVKTLRRPRG